MAGPMVSGWPFSDKWQWKARSLLYCIEGYLGIDHLWFNATKGNLQYNETKHIQEKRQGTGSATVGLCDPWHQLESSNGKPTMLVFKSAFKWLKQTMENTGHQWRIDDGKKTICKLHFLLFPHYSLLSTKCTSHWPRTLTSAQSEEGNTLPGHLPIPHPPPGVTNKAIEMSERESSRTNKAGSKEQQQQRGRSQNNGSQFSTQNMVEHKSASRVIRKRTRCRCCSFCWISNNKELIPVVAVCLLISVLTTAPWQTLVIA